MRNGQFGAAFSLGGSFMTRLRQLFKSKFLSFNGTKPFIEVVYGEGRWL